MLPATSVCFAVRRVSPRRQRRTGDRPVAGAVRRRGAQHRGAVGVVQRHRGAGLGAAAGDRRRGVAGEVVGARRPAVRRRRSGPAPLGAAATVSIVTASPAEATLMLPAMSVCFAVSVCAPSRQRRAGDRPVARAVRRRGAQHRGAVGVEQRHRGAGLGAAAGDRRRGVVGEVVGAGRRRYQTPPTRSGARRRRRRGVDRHRQAGRGRADVAGHVGLLAPSACDRRSPASNW